MTRPPPTMSDRSTTASVALTLTLSRRVNLCGLCKGLVGGECDLISTRLRHDHARRRPVKATGRSGSSAIAVPFGKRSSIAPVPVCKGRQQSSTQIADGGDVADVLTVQSDPSHRSYLPFWGKARGGVHPLWVHSLDVAAVGYELARLRRRTFAALSERLGCRRWWQWRRVG
jgi:hypothetical protein